MTNPTQELVERLPADDTLWCMHVSGADEMHPAPNRATAQLWAAQFTVTMQRRNPFPHPYDPVTNFTVQRWPWSAEAHAEGLAASIANNSWPVDPLATTPVDTDPREGVGEDALAQAFFLLDIAADEGFHHQAGNGQITDATDTVTELTAAFDLECEPGWWRKLAALLTTPNERAIAAAVEAERHDPISRKGVMDAVCVAVADAWEKKNITVSGAIIDAINSVPAAIRASIPGTGE